MGEVLVPVLEEVGKLLSQISIYLTENPEIARTIASVLLLSGAFLSLAGSLAMGMGLFRLLVKAVIPEMLLEMGKTAVAASSLK